MTPSTPPRRGRIGRGRAGRLPVLATAALALAATLLAPGAAAGPEVTVLLFHPDDGVDPFGFPYSPAGDPFATRYAPLVADKQRFDFPFLVADGVIAIEQLPDPDVPVKATRDAYEQATRDRLAEQPPAALRLAATLAGDAVVLALSVEPAAPLEGEDLHLLVALAEDPVRYLGPPGLTNGVEQHRFTVRAMHDLGRTALIGPSQASHTFQLGEGWARDRLVAAAWLQQDAGSPRFDAREVVQATSVAVGGETLQDTKGVLLEMYTATWCEPCLYGDLAVEQVAIAHGAARPLEAGGGPRYYQPPESPFAAFGAAALAAVAAAFVGRRGRGRGGGP